MTYRSTYRLLLLSTLFSALECLPLALDAQQDSVAPLLDMERMGHRDIDTLRSGARTAQIRSATRDMENPDLLPFTTWVITEEDILANGFITLGDVLKAVPGIRVSQPGNTLEGETFMVRGLLGNRYMRILINDVPVKPSGAPGMPIGAQLPIRQAQRIEVYFGPASSVWGNESCAGVVNIILKETERPIFTKAELNFGNFGYNGLDLSFGGKLGRDENIFRYSIYGSSTVREKLDIFYDKDLYNPNYYLQFGIDTTLYTDNPHYVPVIPPDGSPSQIAHESRLFGLAFKWRGLTFNYNRMVRFEHTALGLNPVAISYANPSNRLGERIETFSLGFERIKKKRRAYWTFSAIYYQIDDASTNTLVFDRLSSALYYTGARNTPPDQLPQLRQDVFNLLASNQRFLRGKGLDGRGDVVFQTSIFQNILLNFGGQINFAFAYPLVNHQRGPVDLAILGEQPPTETMPFPPSLSGSIDANLFAQMQWRISRFSFVGGSALNLSPDFNPVFAPRLGILFHIDSVWSAYANAASGFRRPPLYESVNQYRLSENPLSVAPASSSPSGTTERTETAEIGLRLRKPNIDFTSIGFYQQASHVRRDGYLLPTTDGSGDLLYGYASTPGMALRNWGIQQWFVLRSADNWFSNKTPLSLKAELLFQYTRGKEWFGYGIASTDQVRNMPGWTSQVRLYWRQGKFQLALATTRNNGMLSSSVAYQDFYNQQRLRDYNKYRTWDVMTQLFLSEQFLVYLQIQNLFNREYAGIDATSTPDDLLFNPQQRRLIRLGASYNMSDRSTNRF